MEPFLDTRVAVLPLRLPFPSLIGSWVHGVSFSPSGNKLAWVGHNASISVVNAAADGQ